MRELQKGELSILKYNGFKLALPIEEKNCLLTPHICSLYDNFNKQEFDKCIQLLFGFDDFVNLVYTKHKQYLTEVKYDNTFKTINLNTDSNVVLLGFSAGLDSVFQAIKLKEAGYDVKLYFMKNVNTYENGQSYKYAKIIADKLGLELIECRIIKNNDKTSIYKQYWPENPIKNQLILSTMIDYCITHGYNKISLGDDFDLSVKDAAVGINLTDAREITTFFLNGVSVHIKNLEFIPIEKGNDKSARIRCLMKYNLIDDYYSCVQSGRFNKKYHDTIEKKYNIKLFGNNCGTYCRKCAMHNLICHYTGIITFPDDFISKCWEVMWKNAHSADYVFFSPDIPLEQRIQNLYTY